MPLDPVATRLLFDIYKKRATAKDRQNRPLFGRHQVLVTNLETRLKKQASRSPPIGHQLHIVPGFLDCFRPTLLAYQRSYILFPIVHKSARKRARNARGWESARNTQYPRSVEHHVGHHHHRRSSPLYTAQHTYVSRVRTFSISSTTHTSISAPQQHHSCTHRGYGQQQ